MKVLFIAATMALSLPLRAQHERCTGLIRGQATFSPGYLFDFRETLWYLHGSAEYYASKEISITGEAYYMLAADKGSASVFKNNHSLFAGFSRHFGKEGNDFYIGLQPGISFTTINPEKQNGKQTMAYNPLIGIQTGYHFDMASWCYLLINTRLIYGQHPMEKHYNLTEWRLSAGLGFRLQTRKEACE